MVVRHNCLSIQLQQNWFALSRPAMAEALHEIASQRQFGCTKVCFRCLSKNTVQLVKMLAFSNLWMARLHFLANVGQVRL
ncbi:hypothetical protein ACA097_19865 [Pseudomonas sp. QL9]|uniref:hypothetical protein n=1 Tax=Pseudomonas sp. QL9 TaxID=3242725 RepID=UPI00352A8608